MADRWMCLRNLVDVERLSRRVVSDHITTNLRAVLKTCCVAEELSGSARLKAIAERANGFQSHKALQMAHIAQLSTRRDLGDGGWTPKNRLFYLFHQLHR